jgi:hypothetical protein
MCSSTLADSQKDVHIFRGSLHTVQVRGETSIDLTTLDIADNMSTPPLLA